MTVKFVNFFKSSIADVGGIGAGDLEVTLGAGKGAELPTLTGGHHCYLTLVDSSANREVVKVTAIASDTCTIVRGQDGTTPRAFAQGDLVELRLTQGSLEDIQGDISVLEDIIEAITNGTVGTTNPGDFEVDVLGTYPVVTSGFNDGIQNISFPTNGMAAAKFMLGNSNTILWMYLNTAPPGWKVLATGADTVLGVMGGAVYASAGGSFGTWAQPSHTHSGPSHTHTGPSHTHTISHSHQWFETTSMRSWASNGTSLIDMNKANITHNTDIEQFWKVQGEVDLYTKTPTVANSGAGGTGNTGASGTGATGAGVTAATYRPAASVGRLFQLDTP